MYRRVATGLILVALLVAFCFTAVFPPEDKISLGLDLKGGTLLQYELAMKQIPISQMSSVAEEVKKVIYQRLDRYGLKEIEVRVIGRTRIQVAIPGVTPDEIKNVKKQISEAGNLTFHLVPKEFRDKPPNAEELKKLKEDEAKYDNAILEYRQKVADGVADPGPEPKLARIARFQYRKEEVAGERVKRLVLNKDGQPIIDRWYVLHNEPENRVSGKQIRVATTTTDQNGLPAVAFELRGSQFGNLTARNIKQRLAIVLDRQIVSAPEIQSAIHSSGQITGDFTSEEARGLANILSVGSLPTKPLLKQEQTIGARMGHDSIVRGTNAVIIGFLLVVAFMAVYYLKAGLIANFALFFNLLLILTYVATFGQSLSFPGIAGVLLTVGMAVDANILIFERIREELKKGKGLNQAVGAGYNRAFWTIFDANLTTFITGFVLFKVGSGPIQGFAITLMAGLVANFLTALYVSRLFLSVLHKIGLLNQLRMLEAFSTPNINFVSKRRIFATLSAVVLISGMGFLFWRGKEVVGIDFRGGMEVSVNLNQDMGVDQFAIYLMHADQEATLDAYGQHVIPALQ